MKKITLICLIVFFTNRLFAQPGTIDTTFNTTNKGYIGDGTGGGVLKTIIQSDYKIIALFNPMYSKFNGINIPQIVRINTDASIDSSFDSYSGTTNITDANIYRQVDDKLLVTFTNGIYNGSTLYNNIVRINSDGSIDNSFSSSLNGNMNIYEIAEQADHKLLLSVNYFDTTANQTVNKLIRINSDGSNDITFNSFSTSSTLKSILIQSDGKIVGIGSTCLFRIDTNGLLDNTFNNDTLVTNNFPYSDAVIQSDGKIIVFREDFYTNSYTRFLPDGTNDGSFNSDVSFYYTDITRIQLLPDDKFYVQCNDNSTIIRCNANGLIDSTFQYKDGLSDAIQHFSVGDDGRVVISGGILSNARRLGISRLLTSGELDNSFNYRPSADNIITYIEEISDHKIYIAGEFTAYNDTLVSNLIRLLPNGFLDNTFKLDKNLDLDPNNVILHRPDDKLIVAGLDISTGWNNDKKLFLLTSGGSIDTTFYSGIFMGGSYPISCLALQPDGKIIVGGEFTDFDNTTKYNILRLNADGTLDNTFDAGSSAGRVRCITVGPDSTIYIAGLDTINGSSIFLKGLVSLNYDGTLKYIYDDVIYSGIYKIKVMPDGDIFAFGVNTATADVPAIKIKADGNMDSTYFISDISYGIISGTSSQAPNSKLVVGGDFYDPFSPTNDYSNIFRINEDASLDTTFSTGSGFEMPGPGLLTNWGYLYISFVCALDDGGILVAGDFSAYNGRKCASLIKLYGDDEAYGITYVDSTQNCEQGVGEMRLPNQILYINPGNYTVQTNNEGSWKIPDLAPGNYSVTIDTTNGFTTYCPITQYFTITTPDVITVFPPIGLVPNVNGIKNSTRTIKADLYLYPNPATNQLTVYSKEITNMEIYNQLGVLVKNKDLKAGETTIDVSNLPKGLYVCKSGTESVKLIIE